jgi:hypothetical protein
MDWWSISYAVLWLVVVIEALALLVLARAVGAIVLGTRDAIERDGLELGKKAPYFVGIRADGTTTGSSELVQHYAALVFASPSCRICRDMLPDLGRLARGLGDDARVVILLRGSVEDARLMQADVDPALEVWSIGASATAQRYRVRVSPYVQVLDPAGLVRTKGLVNNADQVEHLMFDAGLRNQVTARHAPKLALTKG